MNIYREQLISETPLFEKAWQLYESAFPTNERREQASQEALLAASTNYHCEAILSEEQFIGILFWWEFDELRFIEHFAIMPHLRNRGIGENTLKQFVTEKNTPVILETELPSNIIQQKRIKFYQRLGFHVNKLTYTQPPYRKEDSPTPLLLLSHPSLLSSAIYDYFSSSCMPVIYAQYYSSSK